MCVLLLFFIYLFAIRQCVLLLVVVFLSPLDVPNITQMCSERCSSARALYFALYKGKKCVCGSDETFLMTDKSAGTCDKPCKGDMSLSCGGYYAYDLYELAGYTHSSNN